MTVNEATLQRFIDRQEIIELMLRFGRGLDTNDMELTASCFTDLITIDFSDMEGLSAANTTPKLWADFASEAMGHLMVTHQYSDFTIAIDGDRATGIIYHVSRHRFPNLTGGDQYTQYGSYDNDFQRTEDGWKISVLRHLTRWCDGNPTLINTSTRAVQDAMARVFATTE